MLEIHRSAGRANQRVSTYQPQLLPRLKCLSIDGERFYSRDDAVALAGFLKDRYPVIDGQDPPLKLRVRRRLEEKLAKMELDARYLSMISYLDT